MRAGRVAALALTVLAALLANPRGRAAMVEVMYCLELEEDEDRDSGCSSAEPLLLSRWGGAVTEKTEEKGPLLAPPEAEGPLERCAIPPAVPVPVASLPAAAKPSDARGLPPPPLDGCGIISIACLLAESAMSSSDVPTRPRGAAALPTAAAGEEGEEEAHSSCCCCCAPPPEGKTPEGRELRRGRRPAPPLSEKVGRRADGDEGKMPPARGPRGSPPLPPPSVPIATLSEDLVALPEETEAAEGKTGSGTGYVPGP